MGSPATPETEAANAAAAFGLHDETEAALADRGLIAPADGVPGVRDNRRFAFLGGEVPDTVHPGLWRHAGLNDRAGLFEVVPGRIWQVRGLDLANLTLVAGDTGWIVLDALTNAEAARAALALANEHLGEREVTAVVISHSHIDHFGGVKGVLPEDRAVPVVAPEGFLEAAVAENIAAGNAMFRRAVYMFGAFLPASATGQVDQGIGKSSGAGGTSGLVAPTVEVGVTGTELVLDGVRLVFQVTPDTEAPAELNAYLPDLKALWVPENAVASLHNLYTPRGAEIRDALAWSKHLHETVRLFGGEAEVLFASHLWPRWGNRELVEFLTLQRDAYRYLHDQTLRLARVAQRCHEFFEDERGDELAQDAVVGPAGVLKRQWHGRSFPPRRHSTADWQCGDRASASPLPAIRPHRKAVP